MISAKVRQTGTRGPAWVKLRSLFECMLECISEYFVYAFLLWNVRKSTHEQTGNGSNMKYENDFGWSWRQVVSLHSSAKADTVWTLLSLTLFTFMFIHSTPIKSGKNYKHIQAIFLSPICCTLAIIFSNPKTVEQPNWCSFMIKSKHIIPLHLDHSACIKVL